MKLRQIQCDHGDQKHLETLYNQDANKHVEQAEWGKAINENLIVLIHLDMITKKEVPKTFDEDWNHLNEE